MRSINVLSTAMVASALVACGDSSVQMATSPSLPSVSSTNPVVTASGVTVSQPRPVGNFDSVELGVPGRLMIEHGAVGSLVITADEAVLSVITSEVVAGRLVVALAPNTDLRLSDPLEIEYRVTVPALERLDVSGTVHAVVNGITTSPFEANVSGASAVIASGAAHRQSIVVSGSSRYDGRGLATRDTVLTVSGTAQATVNATDTLSGHVTGAAIVRYVGAPEVSVSVTGAASVAPE